LVFPDRTEVVDGIRSLHDRVVDHLPASIFTVEDVHQDA